MTRRRVVVLSAAAAVLGAATAVAVRPTSARTAARTGTGSGVRSVPLPTGDHVIVDDGGRWVEFRAGAGREAVFHRGLVLDGRHYVIPGDALLLVASGALDIRLFEVGPSRTAAPLRVLGDATGTGRSRPVDGSAWPALTEPDPAVGGVGLGSRRLRPGVRAVTLDEPGEPPVRVAGTAADDGVELSIRYLDRTGTPTPTAVSFLYSVDGPFVRAVAVPEADGTARVRVPPGRYLMDSTVDTARPGRVDPANSVLVTPLLSLDRDTDLIVDAREAEPVSVSVPDPAAVGLGVLAGYRRVTSGPQVLWTHGSPDMNGLYTAHTGPSVPAGFESVVGALFARPGPSGTTRDSPLLYAAGWHRAGAYFTGFRHRVVEAELSTVHAQHDTVAPGRAAIKWIGLSLSSAISAHSLDVVGMPFSRVERYAGTARWASVLTEFAAGTDLADDVTQMQTPTTYRPGRGYTERWNVAPYWPAPRVVRTGGELLAGFAMYSDGSGEREGTGSYVRARVELHRDGDLVGAADRLEAIPFPLADGPARYRLTAVAERAWTPVSSRTSATWTFTASTDPGGGPVLLPLLSVRFVPTGPHGLSVHVMRAAPGAPLRALSVDVSYDGGRTWRPAGLTGDGETRTAVLPRGPGASAVSLRARACDRDGGSVDQTTIDAYRPR